MIPSHCLQSGNDGDACDAFVPQGKADIEVEKATRLISIRVA